MDYKTGKLHKIIRQFDKGNGTYEINGIDRQKTVFLYRKKAEAFIPIPKGNYRINTISDSTQELEIDNIINDVAVEFQIIYQFEIMSSKYEEQFPELDIVVMKLNQIVDDINNIVDYSNSVGIKSDSKFQTQILTPLDPLSVWYMNEEGLIDTMPIDSFNKKFTEIMAKMEELANEKANEKVEHHLNRLQQRITELKIEIEQKGTQELQSLSRKLTQSLEALEQSKNTSISDLESNTSNSLSIIERKGNEIISDVVDLKNESITEIENKKNESKTELESKIPEINSKFNGIAGGNLNFEFIQDNGTKSKGQYYLDRNTGKLYQCIQTTTSSVNSAAYFKDVSIGGIVDRLENLLTFKTFHLSYNNGNLIPNGTRINMPSFINSDNLVNYLIIVRTRDDIRHYISIDGSAAIRQCNFNGIKLKYYGSNNILEVVDNAGILMYLAGTKFLTAI